MNLIAMAIGWYAKYTYTTKWTVITRMIIKSLIRLVELVDMQNIQRKHAAKIPELARIGSGSKCCYFT